MSNYSATTNAYMNLANSQANSAYKSTFLQSGGAYNPTSANATSFTGGNQSIFTSNTTNPINYSDIQQVSASGDENGCTDGADDGKIGFGETVGNFFKGLVSPITSMFESPGNFIKGAAMIAGGALLCAATGGAAAPLLVAAGVGMGGFQAVKGAIGAANAKTDAEAKQAWQDIGCGTGMVAGSIVGAKAAAKGAAAAGVEGFEGAESMNALQATKACITNVGKAGSASLKTFTSGAWKTNLGLAGKGNSSTPEEVKPVKKEVNTTVKETKTATAEPKVTEPKVESKAITEEPKVTEPKVESKAITEEPKVEVKTTDINSKMEPYNKEAKNIIEDFDDVQIDEFRKFLETNGETVEYNGETIRHATTQEYANAIRQDGYDILHGSRNNGSNNYGGMDVEATSIRDFGNRYGETKLEYEFSGKALRMDNKTSSQFYDMVMKSEGKTTNSSTVMRSINASMKNPNIEAADLNKCVMRNLLKDMGYDAIEVAPNGNSMFLTILDPCNTQGLKYIRTFQV